MTRVSTSGTSYATVSTLSYTRSNGAHFYYETVSGSVTSSRQGGGVTGRYTYYLYTGSLTSTTSQQGNSNTYSSSSYMLTVYAYPKTYVDYDSIAGSTTIGASGTTYLTRASTSGTNYGTRASTSGTQYLTRSSTSGTSYLTKSSTSGYSGVSSSSSSQSSGQWI